MNFLSDWITNVILFILLAAVVELLLPSSKMQRYVKMVTGLLLLVILLQPVMAIFSKDIHDFLPTLENERNFEKNLENSIEQKKIEIQRRQRAYISEQVAVQMKKQVEEELMQSFDLIITNLNIVFTEDYFEPTDKDAITNVAVHLKRATKEEGGDQLVKAVEVVSIDTKKEWSNPAAEDDHLFPIRTLLSSEWQIHEDKIFLVWEGGDDS